MELKRNNYLDLLKGYAIILVIIGHVIQFSYQDARFYENWLFKIIYSFHMPLFISISGYLFYFSAYKGGFVDLLIKKSKQLIIPLCIWSLLIYIRDHIYQFPDPKTFIIEYLKFIPRYYWFLWVLFLCIVCQFLLERYFNNLLFYIIFLLVLVLIPDISSFKYFQYLYPYFVAGFMLNKYDSLKLNLKAPVILFLFCLYAFGIYFWNNSFYIYTTGISFIHNRQIDIWQIYIDIYRFAMGFLGCILFIRLTYLAYSHISGFWIERIGLYSLGIYLIHVAFAKFIYVPEVGIVSAIFLLIMYTLLLLVGSYFLTKTINTSAVLRKLLLGGR